MEKKIDWKMIIIRVGYWSGAILDLLSAIASTIYMLSPNPTFIDNIFGWEPINDMSFMLLITECSLMWGWTVLLIWGVRKPIERRDVLLLTAIPVVFLIISFNVVAIIQGNSYWTIGRILPPTIVIIIMIIGYIFAKQITKKEIGISTNS